MVACLSSRATLCRAQRRSASDNVGLLTTYLSVSASPIDGACEFSGGPVNSSTDPILASYLRRGMHCAIGSETPAYGEGELCGGCYRVRSINDNGIDGDSQVPGTKSEAVVMVSTGGITGPGRFDCFPEAFAAITGASRGEFDIEFEQTECSEIATTPTVVQFGEPNNFFCKVVFENIAGWGTLDSVTGCLGDAQLGSDGCKEMRRLSGQAWTGCPTGSSDDKIRFYLGQAEPSEPAATEAPREVSQIECICKGSWPWPKGDSCTCGVNFGGITMSETSTTGFATSTTAQDGTGGGNTGGGGGGNDGTSGDAIVESGTVSLTAKAALTAAAASLCVW